MGEALQAGGAGGVTETAQNIKSMSLPEKWTTTKLKDISEKITKGSTPTSYGYSYKTEGIKFIKAENIDENSNVFSTTNFIDEETNEFLKRSILHENDLLFSIAGTIGRIALIKKTNLPANTNQALAIIRTLPGVISHKYLLYYLKSDAIQKKALKKIVGVGRANLSLKNVGEFEIPIAPENEQKRIVAEIEKQFSRLDEAVDNLKRVKANLKRYKASVLKAAVEGKLTEEWRKSSPDVEPADKLLERILVERRKKWEKAALARLRERAARRQAKMETKGAVPKDDKWKKKYKEPPQVNAVVLPELPDGWAWANFERLAEDIPHALKAGPFGSSLKKSFYVPNGYKIYGQEQVLRNDPSYGDYYIDEDRYENLKSCAVKPGDILISLVGTIGKVLILPDDIEPGIINPRLVKLSLDRRLVDSNYIKIYLQSPYVKYLFSIASHGGTMDILNLTILKEIPIPIPLLVEQNKITEEVENKLSIIDGIEKEVSRNLIRADRLRQSILKRAFSGKLGSENKSQDN